LSDNNKANQKFSCCLRVTQLPVIYNDTLVTLLIISVPLTIGKILKLQLPYNCRPNNSVMAYCSWVWVSEVRGISCWSGKRLCERQAYNIGDGEGPKFNWISDFGGRTESFERNISRTYRSYKNCKLQHKIPPTTVTQENTYHCIIELFPCFC